MINFKIQLLSFSWYLSFVLLGKTTEADRYGLMVGLQQRAEQMKVCRVRMEKTAKHWYSCNFHLIPILFFLPIFIPVYPLCLPGFLLHSLYNAFPPCLPIVLTSLGLLHSLYNALFSSLSPFCLTILLPVFHSVLGSFSIFSQFTRVVIVLCCMISFYCYFVLTSF